MPRAVGGRGPGRAKPLPLVRNQKSELVLAAPPPAGLKLTLSPSPSAALLCHPAGGRWAGKEAPASPAGLHAAGTVPQGLGWRQGQFPTQVHTGTLLHLMVESIAHSSRARRVREMLPKGWSSREASCILASPDGGAEEPGSQLKLVPPAQITGGGPCHAPMTASAEERWCTAKPLRSILLVPHAHSAQAALARRML